MTKLKDLTEAKKESGRQANPDFMNGVDAIINEAKAIEEGKHALKIGDVAPLFTLPDPKNTSVSLLELLKKGPVIVTFYRGSWCPYCNLQLKALQERVSEINALGATLVAISPQAPDGSLSDTAISELNFTVLSDQDANVAEKFGVAWKVPEFLLEHMRVDRELDLEKINNGNAHILPIPATFILDSNAVIKWRFVNIDYRTRAEPRDIIEALKTIS
ncbi:peroxiredoxin-like family protein [Bizionia sp. KMM 8389]